MTESEAFKAGLIEHLPHLRAFARMIARNPATADDLVQDTLLRALAHRHQYQSGTNLRGWLVMIMRNHFFNMMRKSSRAAEVAVDQLENLRSVDGGQEIAIEMRDFRAALDRMPVIHREALILVAGAGYSYDEAAEMLGCPPGTIKSRVSRARADLESQLHGVERPGLRLTASA